MAGKASSKTAIGMSVNGNVLHVVHMAKQSDGYVVEAASKYTLQKTLDVQVGAASVPEDLPIELLDDYSSNGESVASPSMDYEESNSEPEDLGDLDLMDISEDMPEEIITEEEEESSDDAGIFVTILNAAKEAHSRVGISVNEPQIFYNVFDTDWGLKGPKLRKRILEELSSVKEEYGKLKNDALGILPMSQERMLGVIREFELPLFEQMEGVKSFMGGRLPNIAFLESIEISLVNLVLQMYQPAEDIITVVLHVGADASRFFFLNGRELHHIGPLIPEDAQSSNLANTIASRLLLEVDDLGLQGIDHVLICGEKTRDDMIAELTDRLSPEVAIENFDLTRINTTHVNEDGYLDLKPFAPAIGTAIRILESGNNQLLRIDLTPYRIKEGQNVLQLSTTGWMLIPIILLLGTLILTLVNQKEKEIKLLENLIEPRRSIMAEYTTLLDSVTLAETTMQGFARSTVILDSLVAGTDRWSQFVGRLMRLTDEIGGFWFTEVSTEGENSVTLGGYSIYRNRIPTLIDSLGDASLRRVEVQDIREKRVYRFEIVAKLP